MIAPARTTKHHRTHDRLPPRLLSGQIDLEAA
jgi:hypothetical protein